MRKSVLISIILLLGLIVATVCYADIRQLMKARGYSMSSSGGACMGSCDATPGPEPVDIVTQPPLASGCTFPATFPCTMN